MTDPTISAIILGIVQGLTEFLPISSSGHLILVRDFLHLGLQNSLAFDAVLQLATTLAVLVYFWKDLSRIFLSFIKIVFSKLSKKEVGMELKSDKVLILAIIYGTIPAVILGLLLESVMETVFRSSFLVSGTLILGALVMLWAEKFSAKRQISELDPKKGFKIGLFQSLALVPGMSRSGMTISGGLFTGLSREVATKFSFILAFPILFGSGLKKLLDLFQEGYLVSGGWELLLGSIASFLVGLFAIHFLIKFLQKHTLKSFAYYRIVLAILILIFWL